MEIMDVKNDSESEGSEPKEQTQQRQRYLSPPGLTHLFNSPKFSDFTIFVEGRMFHAHKAILSCYSAYFYNLFKSDWKETASNTITLTDDNPYAVEAMLQHLYGMDYIVAYHPGLSIELFDAKVYAIAEKFGIPSLKDEVKTMFTSQVKETWNSEDFPPAVAEVYATTPQTDRGLRDVVTDVACEHIKDLLKKEDFVQAVLEGDGFVIDLLSRLNDKLELQKRFSGGLISDR
ncbi:hypothetical protein VTN77DRAFT_422 [Rasamsonia byssochlamydoides]|uniref:uncharacterized protein n=1 Tax=Rasamsonia byssochlamydoides TaxID=89139 RepID=UPI003744603B